MELHITVVVKRAYKALVLVKSIFPQPSKTVYLAECQIVKRMRPGIAAFCGGNSETHFSLTYSLCAYDCKRSSNVSTFETKLKNGL